MLEVITSAIQKNKETILSLVKNLRENPELGFFEYKSSAFMKQAFESLGLVVEGPFARTGLKVTIQGGKTGPTVALIGELDAVGSPQNPMANELGVAHACGHYLQCAQVVAAASALLAIKNELCGNVVLLAVPAEEFLEIEKRLQLKQKGEITYLSGKPELVKLGVLDGVDMAMMLHANPDTPEYRLFLEGTNLGFTAKNIFFKGRAAHGSEPFEGRNALQAAMLFLNGVNANRETFRDNESIRIHPIITKGGSVVNSVPDDVRVETYVRGSSKDAIEKGCTIVDRCAKAGALMMGCEVEIQTIPGYLPILQDKCLSDKMKEVAEEVLGEGMYGYGVPCVGSTDMGDLSQLIPIIQPTMGGFLGGLHSAAFKAVDEWKSCEKGGALLSALTYRLLKDDAKEAKEVLSHFKANMTKEEYFSYMNN